MYSLTYFKIRFLYRQFIELLNALFQILTFSTKKCLIFSILTHVFILNTHLRAYFMPYTNLLQKLEEKILPLPDHTSEGLRGTCMPKIKTFFYSFQRKRKVLH
jgi:hypothetical protein